MRIPRRIIVNPDHNRVLATLLIAMSVFIIAYATIFGPLSILLFLGMWLALPLFGPARTNRVAMVVMLLLSLPLFACASALWSEFPAHTLRAALQYLSLAVCAAIAATYVSVRSLSWGLLIGCHFVVAWSLMSGYEVYDYFGNSYAYAGLFNSKNTFGFFASIGLLATCAVIALLSGRNILRAGIAVAGLQFPYALYISDSVTSLVSIAGATLFLIAALVLGRLNRRLRRMLIIALLVPLSVAAIAIAFTDVTDLVLLTGRDATLTGRTDLWLAGLSVFAESPILGVGYQGFWRIGVPLAEQLWSDFYITDGVGFHFHNTYIAVLADLGVVGLVLFLLPLLSAFWGAARGTFRAEDNRDSAICLSFVALFVIRSVAEVDTFAAYQIGGFLFFYFAVLPWRQAIEAQHLMKFRYWAAQPDLHWTYR